METTSKFEQELIQEISDTADALTPKRKALERLQAEVRRLEARIQAYEGALMQYRTPADGDAPEATTTVSLPDRFTDKELASLSMAQMAARALEKAGERLGAGDIHERMIEMGWAPSAKASLASLRTCLYRERDKSEGLIVQSEEKGKFELRSSHDADATRGEGEEGNTN